MAEKPYKRDVTEGHWTTELSEVTLDGGICCTTLFCPCYTYGKNSQRLGGRCVPDALACLFLGPCAFLASYSSRHRLKKKYDLPKEPFGDLWVACLCLCCALCQEAREIHARREDELAVKFDTIRSPPPGQEIERQ